MLEFLDLKNVGPAPAMRMDLAPRLNLITGDNGLGKSFLLDVAWWALTRKWPQDLNANLTSGYAARPQRPRPEGEHQVRPHQQDEPRRVRERLRPRRAVLARTARAPVEPRPRHLCARRRRLRGLGLRTELLEEEGQRRHPGPPAGVRVQLQGGVGRPAGHHRRPSDPGQQRPRRGLGVVDPGRTGRRPAHGRRAGVARPRRRRRQPAPWGSLRAHLGERRPRHPHRPHGLRPGRADPLRVPRHPPDRRAVVHAVVGLARAPHRVAADRPAAVIARRDAVRRAGGAPASALAAGRRPGAARRRADADAERTPRPCSSSRPRTRRWCWPPSSRCSTSTPTPGSTSISSRPGSCCADVRTCAWGRLVTG